MAQKERLAEAGAQIDGAAKTRWRRGGERGAVGEQGIAQQQVDLGERQRRGVLRGIFPGEAAVENQDFVLLEQPVGELLRGVALAAAVQRDAYAADLQMVGVGPGDGEVGAADHQLIEGGGEAGQAFPRGRGFNGSELQRGLALRTVDAHIAQGELRHQPVPLRLDRADMHRQPQRLAADLLDPGAELLRIGQHGVAQGQQARAEHEIHREHEQNSRLKDAGGGAQRKMEQRQGGCAGRKSEVGAKRRNRW